MRLIGIQGKSQAILQRGSWWKGKDLKVFGLDFEFESNRIAVNFRVIILLKKLTLTG